MRFERCYRIDDDPNAPLPDKRSCWLDWTTNYTRGQERSRVRYAKERLQTLETAARSIAKARQLAPGEPGIVVVEDKLRLARGS